MRCIHSVISVSLVVLLLGSCVQAGERQVNKTPHQIPKQGHVFAVPLSNARFGAAVLIDTSHGFRFLVFNGFWGKMPTFEEATLSDIMPMYEDTGPEQNPGEDERSMAINKLFESPLKGWFKGPFPKSFTILGEVSLESEGLHRYLDLSGTMVFQSVDNFVDNMTDRWRLRFDREAYIQQMELRRKDYEEKESRRRDNRTLKTMLRERPFSHWVEIWPRSTVNKAHRIVQEATRKLIALQEADDNEAQSIAVLRQVVDEFNTLYDQTGCIETEEAAEIVEWVEQLGARVGLSNEDEKLTGHRTW